MTKILIASDHAGVKMKEFFMQQEFAGIELVDLGPASGDSVDYPDYAEKLCTQMQEQKIEKGILVCGSGIGMSMAANKFPGIRAAHTETVTTARLAGEHNQANVLCIGERITEFPQAKEMVDAWLGAEFGGEGADEGAKSRHTRRIQKIHALEK